VQPILEVGDVAERIASSSEPVVAVSPLIGGRALKGPADKIFLELGREPTALGIARYYRDLIDGIVIDTVDADLKQPIEALGLRVMIDDTVMKSRADQARLARTVVDFALNIAEHAHG
jgi:LPPG:FO 2-phospho-L-lactate transferase